MDKESPDLSHSADRDSHFLAAPHVPLLEEHVGYMVAARFHDQPLDLPYLAVGRTDGQPAVYLYLAEWDGVLWFDALVHNVDRTWRNPNLPAGSIWARMYASRFAGKVCGEL